MPVKLACLSVIGKRKKLEDRVIVFLNSISGLVLVPILYSLPFVFLILGLGSALLIWIIRY